MKKAVIDYNYCRKELGKDMEKLDIHKGIEEITFTKFIITMMSEDLALSFFMDLRQKLGPIKLILQCLDHGEMIRTFSLLQDYEMKLDQVLEVTRPLSIEHFPPSSISLHNCLIIAKNNGLRVIDQDGINHKIIKMHCMFVEFELRKVDVQGDLLVFTDVEITRLIANKYESEDKISLPKDSITKIIMQCCLSKVAIIVRKENLHRTKSWDTLLKNFKGNFEPNVKSDLNFQFKMEIKKFKDFKDL